LAEKSRDAFRTISEVADWLDVPTHVLRFWESRFSQIKPVKRAGGRRYYRPSDMRVIGGVKVLLHDQGMTIRGVQKLFREEGIKHVAGYAPELFGETDEDEAPVLNAEALERAARPASPARSTHDAEPAPETAPETATETETETVETEAADADPQPGDDAPPLFRRSRPAAEPQPVPEAAVAEAEPAAPAAVIPPTPDVPDTDPADDAEAHEKEAGIAARLKLADPSVLASHQALLAAASERLAAIANRAD
jgi:DNA-binding transcriptional MerR regulator